MFVDCLYFSSYNKISVTDYIKPIQYYNIANLHSASAVTTTIAKAGGAPAATAPTTKAADPEEEPEEDAEDAEEE